MARGGRDKIRDEPERRCIATGESGPVQGLIRFVVGPGDDIVPDLAERLPGRGIWVSATPEALAKAVKKNLFPRAARQQVSVPDDLPARVEALLSARLVEHFALARKAGLVIGGHDKVKARLKEGPVAALIEAADGSEQGKAKLRPLAGDAPIVACLTGSELGLAFGRDHVIHAALDAGGIADRLLREAARLSGLRGFAAPSGPSHQMDDGAADRPETIG